MTPAEFADMLSYMESRWGTLHRGWSQSQVIWQDFRPYPNDLATEAVRDLYYDGINSCPSPSKVVASVRVKTATRGTVFAEHSPNWCDGNHTWGFETLPDGKREAMCVRCGEQRTYSAGDIRTPGELADDPKPPAPKYDTTDVPY